MNSIKFFGWASILILLVFVGCRKDLIVDDTTIDTEEPRVVVNSTITVFVLDENNEPIEDVEITLNDKKGKSNQVGVYKFENLPMNELGQTIELSHPDYYELQKVFYPRLNTSLMVKVMLMSKEKIATINSSEGGLVTTDRDARLTLPADGFMYTNGTNYSGPVDVYVRWLNPTSEDLGLVMPGNLRAKDIEDNLVQLVTYGMMAVELESPSGEKLQIKTGKTATLDFPLPSETLNQAPETIPLWYYNTDLGYWIEESEAKLVDSRYVGVVSHFSFWNCDAPFPTVKFTARLVDDLGNPLSELLTRIKLSTGIAGYAISDSEGMITGQVPKDVEMNLEVIDICNDIFYTQNIGPFSTDTNYGDIIVTPANVTSFFVDVTGRLLNCSGTPVEDGEFLLKGDINSAYINVADDGTFSTSILACSEQTMLGFAYDNATSKSKENIELEITSSNSVIDLGDISVCDVIQSGVFIQTDYPLEQSFTQLEVNAYYSQNSLLTVYATKSTVDSTNFSLVVEQVEPIPQTIPSNLFYSDYTTNTNNEFAELQISTTCPLEITKFDGPGGVLSASVECEFIYTDNTGVSTTTYGTVEIVDVFIN